MASVNKSKSSRIAYVLDKEALSRLDRLLKEFSQEIDYKVSCTGDVLISYSSIDELLHYANTKRERIVELTISTRGQAATNIIVRFRQSGEVEYQVSGQEKEVFFAADKLESFVSNTRRWYTAIAPFKFERMLRVVFLFVLLVLGFWILVQTSIGKLLGLPLDAFRAFMFLLIGIDLLASIAIGLIIIVFSPLFPVSTFAIGEGLQRHQTLSFIRTSVLFLGIVLPLVASLLSRFIQ